MHRFRRLGQAIFNGSRVFRSASEQFRCANFAMRSVPEQFRGANFATWESPERFRERLFCLPSLPDRQWEPIPQGFCVAEDQPVAAGASGIEFLSTLLSALQI